MSNWLYSLGLLCNAVVFNTLLRCLPTYDLPGYLQQSFIEGSLTFVCVFMLVQCLALGDDEAVGLLIVAFEVPQGRDHFSW